MRLQRLILSVVLMCSPVLPAFAAVQAGDAAPDFTAKDTNGNDVSLASLKGKTVVLEWTNADCPFVKKHYGSGNMQKTQKYAADKGAVWISIISSAEGKQGYVSDEEANAIAKERGSNAAHIVRDPKGVLGHLYDAKTTPHLFVIDKEGVLAYEGAIDSEPTADPADIDHATNYIIAALDTLAEGKRPEPASTRSYGCSVKY